jgi:5-hydroxyisourate hydrolase
MALTTHVLDTAHGCPAAGMAVALFALDALDAPHGERAESRPCIARIVLNADGRAAAPLLDAASMRPGRYRLAFEVAAYFRSRGVALPEPPFLDVVTLDFGIADSSAHYHVPLLVSPWSYSTYRGS